jgi:DNA-binding transcriptional LysR family regulator
MVTSVMNNGHLTTLRPVNLNLLSVFKVIYDERHIGRAAARLGLTPSAVSHALARMRQLLGDPLFVRTQSGIEPTPRAKHLAVPIFEGLSHIEKIFATPASFDPSSTTRAFTLAVLGYGTASMTPALVAALRRHAAGARLHVRRLSLDEALMELDAGTLDIVAGHMDALPERFIRHEIMVDDYVVLAREGHPALRRKIDAKALSTLGLLEATDNPHSLAHIARYVANDEFPLVPVASVPHLWMVPYIVEKSDLVCIAPRGPAALLSRQCAVRLVKCACALPRIQIHIARHRRSENDAAVRWLAEMIDRVVAAPSGRRSGAMGPGRRRSGAARRAEASGPAGRP